jgi:hypothetical protein
MCFLYSFVDTKDLDSKSLFKAVKFFQGVRVLGNLYCNSVICNLL